MIFFRFKDVNIIVVALFHGKEKPDVKEFVRPLAEEMHDLSTKGVFVRDNFFKVFITNAALDLPAKALVSQIMQYNSGKCACNFCLQRGKKTSKGMRYIYEDHMPALLRTHDSMIEDIVQVNSMHDTVIHGIKASHPWLLSNILIWQNRSL